MLRYLFFFLFRIHLICLICVSLCRIALNSFVGIVSVCAASHCSALLVGAKSCHMLQVALLCCALLRFACVGRGRLSHVTVVLFCYHLICIVLHRFVLACFVLLVREKSCHMLRLICIALLRFALH